MTKAQLIKALEPYPDNMDVFVDGNSIDVDFRFNLVNEVTKQTITFKDNEDLKAKDDVIVLDAL